MVPQGVGLSTPLINPENQINPINPDNDYAISPIFAVACIQI
jgi:hypothetical protein